MAKIEITPLRGNISAESVNLPDGRRILSEVRIFSSGKSAYVVTYREEDLFPRSLPYQHGSREEDEAYPSPEAALAGAGFEKPSIPTASVERDGEALILKPLDGNEWVARTYIGGFVWRVHCYLHGV